MTVTRTANAHRQLVAASRSGDMATPLFLSHMKGHWCGVAHLTTSLCSSIALRRLWLGTKRVQQIRLLLRGSVLFEPSQRVMASRS